jgi:hypothetical protein
MLAEYFIAQNTCLIVTVSEFPQVEPVDDLVGTVNRVMAVLDSILGKKAEFSFLQNVQTDCETHRLLRNGCWVIHRGVKTAGA